MWSSWDLTDSDCCQYMRRDYPYYEMIQVVWIDDIKLTDVYYDKEYVVVRDSVNISSLSGNDIEIAISSYGYNIADCIEEYGDAANDLIAEYYLECSILEDCNIIAAFNTMDECEKFIQSIRSKEDES